MTVAAETWERVLGRLQDDLDSLDRSLADGDEVVTSPWSPPEGLGPLPADLRGRADELLGRIQDTASRLTDAKAQLAGVRRDVGRRRAAGAAYQAAPGGEVSEHTA